jgi:plasmid stabilization system protein ParE
MSRLIVSAAAEADYTAALTWYAECSERAAELIEVEFARALKYIADNPRMFPLCDSRHRYCRVRRYPYQIINSESIDEVVVVAVAHTSRRPRYWEERS